MVTRISPAQDAVPRGLPHRLDGFLHRGLHSVGLRGTLATSGAAMAQTDAFIPANENLGVVAASAYVNGRRVADVSLAEAGAWAQRPVTSSGSACTNPAPRSWARC